MSDDEFDTWMETLPPPPGWRSLTEDDEAAEWARLDAEADADIAAGRVYPHELVSRWLATWGSPDYQPFQQWLKSAG